MAGKKIGRPSKIDPEVTRTVSNLLRAGAMIDAACSSAGISRDTFYEWLKRGRTDKSGPYKEFADTIKKALADAENSLVAGIRKAGGQQWQALAWLLERRFRERWGRDLPGAETKSTANSPPPKVESRESSASS